MEPILVLSSTAAYSRAIQKLLSGHYHIKYRIWEKEMPESAEAPVFSERVSLIILDPIPADNYQPLTVIRDLRSQPVTGRIPLFGIARCPDKNNKLESLALGINDYLAMPVSRKEVLLRCSNLIEQYFDLQNVQDGLHIMSHIGRSLRSKNRTIKEHYDLLEATVAAQEAAMELGRKELKERDSTLHAQQAVLEMSRREMKEIDRIRAAHEAVSEMSRNELLEANRNLQKSYENQLEAMREKSELQLIFGKYISPSVIEHLSNTNGLKSLQGEKKHVSILFADIRGFTALSDLCSPDTVVMLLNEFFTELTEIIIKYNGIIDKYSGDNIMAIFGAPVDDPGHLECAVKAAIGMQQQFALLAANWSNLFQIEAGLGIGINCGDTIVGNIGSFHKISYTAIGDTVNMAARFEQLAQTGQIVCGETVKEMLSQSFLQESGLECIPLGARNIKGKTGSYPLYNLYRAD